MTPPHITNWQYVIIDDCKVGSGRVNGPLGPLGLMQWSRWEERQRRNKMDELTSRGSPWTRRSSWFRRPASSTSSCLTLRSPEPWWSREKPGEPEGHGGSARTPERYKEGEGERDLQLFPRPLVRWSVLKHQCLRNKGASHTHTHTHPHLERSNKTHALHAAHLQQL